MSGNVKAIPEGYGTITPHIIVKNGEEAIEFYKKAFGAEEIFRMPGPGGKGVMHAELKIGNSRVMLDDERPQGNCRSPQSQGGTTFVVHLYVENADAAFDRATKAGAKVEMPLMDAFWGDRYGMLSDPFGHHWSIATHIKDLTPAEIEKGATEFFANMGKQGGC